MLAADRDAFESHLGALCAGFNVPMTELRTEAYWRGLQQMHLLQFARTVEHALGEEGPERIPTVPQMWAVWKKVRNRRPAQTSVPATAVPPAFDSLHAFGQRCLMRWLLQNGPVTDEHLARLIQVKNRLVGQFRQVRTECDITAEEVRESLLEAFRRAA
jgi:hypothetical protein